LRVGVLGGSRFIGFHLVEALLAQGHEVSVFNRGRTARPRPLPERVRRVRGDRNEPATLGPFFDRSYDAVVDLSGYTPVHVREIVSRWRSRIGHYVFCSSSSVYRVPPPVPHTESAPILREAGTYGGDKALAEDEIMAAGHRAGWPVTALRPQGVFGPHGAHQALYVFRRQLAQAPIVIRPEAAGRRISLLFVDDFVRQVIGTLGQPTSFGRAFNAAGPDVCSAEEFTALAQTVTGAAATAPVPLSPELSAKLPELGLPWLDHDLVTDASSLAGVAGAAETPLATALAKTWAWASSEPWALRFVPQRWEREAVANRRPSWWHEQYWRARDNVPAPVKTLAHATLGRARRTLT
jgi:2'-hydroxyisoflavone reductase